MASINDQVVRQARFLNVAVRADQGRVQNFV